LEIFHFSTVARGKSSKIETLLQTLTALSNIFKREISQFGDFPEATCLKLLLLVTQAVSMKLLPVRPHNTRSTSSLEAIAQSVNDWSNRSSRCRDCRLCRYYQPTGRRGGICQLLSVSVKGSWDACAVAESSF